jgi:uncharacterized protein
VTDGGPPLLVDTTEGIARVTTSRPPGRPVGLLVLGHGAGGLRWTDDVLATRDTAVAAGWAVALVDQPWRVAGRRVAGPPASLDRGWLAALDALEANRPQGLLVVGGRSAGARVACRTAAAAGADAVVALSFPLHPPGRPERTRAEELALAAADGIPVHVVQGSTDPFGTPVEVRSVLPPGATLDVVVAPHALERVAGDVATLVLARLSRLTGG